MADSLNPNIVGQLVSSIQELVRSHGEQMRAITSLVESTKESTEQQLEATSQQRTQQVQFQKEHSEIMSSINDLVNKMVANQSTSSPDLTDSSVTNPFTADINPTTKYGQQLYMACTEVPDSIQDNKLTASVVHYDKIFDFFNEFESTKGYKRLLQVPTKGTGVPASAPKKLTSGEEVANVDLSDCKSIINEATLVTDANILAFAGYIHGTVDCGLVKSTDMEQKSLDLADQDTNRRLTANSKFQLRVRSSMVLVTLQKMFTNACLESFIKPHKSTLEYKREDSGETFVDGLTLLWYIIQAIEPKSVIDADKFEKIIASTTLKECENNVREYLATMKTAYDNLQLRHGSDRMNQDKLLQHIFNALEVIETPIFKQMVQQQYSVWVCDSKNFSLQTFFDRLEQIYNSLVTAGKWDEKPKPDPKMIAMQTDLKKLKKENAKLQEALSSNSGGKGGSRKQSGKEGDGTPKVERLGAPGTPDYNIEKWRTEKKGDTIVAPAGSSKAGELHQWCPHHREGKGLYMVCNSSDGKSHDHAAWQKVKDSFKKRKKEKEGSKELTGPKKLKVTAGTQRDFTTQKRAYVTNMVENHKMDHHAAEASWEAYSAKMEGKG